jgi:hypothetical protein
VLSPHEKKTVRSFLLGPFILQGSAHTTSSVDIPLLTDLLSSPARRNDMTDIEKEVKSVLGPGSQPLNLGQAGKPLRPSPKGTHEKRLILLTLILKAERELKVSTSLFTDSFIEQIHSPCSHSGPGSESSKSPPS